MSKIFYKDHKGNWQYAEGEVLICRDNEYLRVCACCQKVMEIKALDEPDYGCFISHSYCPPCAFDMEKRNGINRPHFDPAEILNVMERELEIKLSLHDRTTLLAWYQDVKPNKEEFKDKIKNYHEFKEGKF